MNAQEKAERLELALQSQPQVDCPVRHYFAPGLFAREITIPEGTVLVGAVHKAENIAILSQGSLLLATDDGPVEIHAPCTLTVKPGAKNAALATKTAVWTNFFPNPENVQDIDVLVELFTTSKACELLGGPQNKQLMANKLTELEA